MLSLEQVKARLRDRRLAVVAEATGLTYNTLWRIMNERTKSVSYDVVKRLSDYLTGDGER